MKLIRGYAIPVIELTRRNLEVLLAKLDDEDSERMLIGQESEYGATCAVKAVENEAHYADREPGPMFVNGEYL